jgi:hypothetical protein
MGVRSDLATLPGTEKLSAPAHAFSQNTTHAPGDGSGTITVPDARLLFSGDYRQSGLDLILSKDGHDFTIHDYFRESRHADLMSPDGARLNASLVDALTAGHTQYAQAAGAPEPAKVIGQVAKLTGSATAIRNGVAVELHVGDNVMKGDVVQAGNGSLLNLTFIDGTVFGLSSNARMVLNEMVYDPNGSSNSSLLSLIQGTISFVAGETAKHGDMKVDTPVATMGIRGTAVLVEIGFDVQLGNAPPVHFEVLLEKGNVVGSFELRSKTDPSVLYGTVDQRGVATFLDGAGNLTQGKAPPLSDLAKQIITETYSLYFPGYFPDLDSANPQSNPGSHGSPPYEPPGGGLGPTPQSFPLDQPVTAPVPINLPTNGPNNQTNPETVLVTVTKFSGPPTVTKASFSILGGTSVVLASSNIQATDQQGDKTFKYTVSNVSHGTFQIFDGQHWVDTATFTTDDLDHGIVRFVTDGSNLPPQFSIQANSGQTVDSVSDVLGGIVNFTPHLAPQISSASLVVHDGDSVVLSPSNFVVSDSGSTSFTFTLSNVSHGSFQVTTDGIHWLDTSTFTSAELGSGHVRFLADESGDAPTFSVQADDGLTVNHLSNTVDGVVQFASNVAPIISGASFAVTEGASVVLTTSDFSITDPDSSSFTFAVSKVTHGTFQLFAANQWTDTTAFTSTDLAAGHVRFLTDGSGDVPTFAIQVDDGAAVHNLSNVRDGTVTFTPVNDPPYITGATATGSVPSGLLTPTAAAYLTGGHDLVNGLGGTSGFGTSIGRNDDDSSQSLDLAAVFGSGGLNFFGHTYAHIWVNNNGNVTFAGPNSTFTPGAITAGSNPIIAPFWADVDTRGGAVTKPSGGGTAGSNLVYYSLDANNHVLTVTWDDVGYYNAHTNKLDAFQLQLIGLGDGNFDIVFRYQSINWTTGDASGGLNGLGGSVARVGYSAGDGNAAHYFELPGSGNQPAMLGLESATGNTGIAGVDVFQVISGAVTNAPIAGGMVSFADPDDTAHTASFVPEGAGYKGSFTLDPVAESNGAGSVAWHFAMTASEINAIPIGTPLVQSYVISISDGHPGGQATQAVSVMVGSAGSDVIHADQAVDVLIGSGGNDSFVFNAHIGQQTIADFTPGADKIDISQISGVTADNLASWISGGNGVAAHATQVGSDTLIDLDQTPHGTDTILLKNIVLSNLHASDFIVHPGGAGI